MRSIWNGHLTLGLVTIPVGLATAARRDQVSFRTLHQPCGTPIRQQRVCPEHGALADDADLARGWEFAKGQFVLVDETDIEIGRGREIRIVAFTGPAAVTALHRDRAYWLIPPHDPIGLRPYRLLHEAIRRRKTVAIARLAPWGKEELALVEADETKTMRITTLFLDRELHRPQPGPPLKVDRAQLDLVDELVAAMTDPAAVEEALGETRDQELRELLDAKLTGGQVVRPNAAGDELLVAPLDLVKALQSSIDRAQRPQRRRKARSTRSRRHATATTP